MDERYPKFGMLGFDTGYFFLKGLSRYGSGFEKNLDKMDLVPIQTGFKFQRVNNWGRIYQPESVLCTLHQEFRTDKARL